MNKAECTMIIRSQNWKRADDPPHHNSWVYGYFPEIGNDDEGYGYVDLVYFDGLCNYWCDRNGKSDPQPTLWCYLYEPENPFIHFDTPEEAKEFREDLEKNYPKME